jgi:hypothetical protein
MTPQNKIQKIVELNKKKKLVSLLVYSAVDFMLYPRVDSSTGD